MSNELIHRQIGDFIIHERIGQGAMSVVYRAVQQSVNRSIALKIINFRANPLILDNYQPYFIQEARVISMLEHIHIVPIYNYGTVDSESSYIAMRLLRGGSLQDLLAKDPPRLERAIDIFTQTAQGLANAHSRGILHRDLKPSNILLDDLGNAYLTDFGLGKLAEVQLDLTESGTTIGTPLYAAPEQFTGEPIGTHSDIYSMGAILYHVLAGRPPYEFGEGGLMEFIRKQDEEQPAPLRSLNPNIPSEIDDTVLQALRRDPKERPESIEAMAESLNLALGRRMSRSSDPVIYLPPERPKLPLLPIAGGVVAIAVIILAAVLWFTTRPRFGQGIAGERGTFEATIPTEAEIEAARDALGDNGFIAYIACVLDSEYQTGQTRIIAETANEYGLPFRFYDSELDPYRQITQIERAQLEGAKAIILCSLNASALDEKLRLARQRDIPLVFVTPMDTSYNGVMIDLQNYDLGLRAGSAAGELIAREMGGEAEIVILNYPGLKLSDERVAGMQDALRETAPNSHIVGYYPGFSVLNGEQSVRELLNSDTAFDVILSITDAGAFGAIEALEAANVPNDAVTIISINGEESAEQFVRAGRYLYATIPVDREAASRAAMNAMVRLLGGASIPEKIIIPADSAE